MAFGGLGVMMFSGPPAIWSIHMAVRRVDMQSFFFASMFVVIVLILAYLTNPTETSFRTFLTEQSFRQHLKRLDDDNQDDHSHRDDTGVHFTLSSRRAITDPQVKSNRPFMSDSAFHFANRASVSLRTPKHLFQSFGIFTIAAVVPTNPRSPPHHHHRSRIAIDGTSTMVSDSWYIGAFGKWWRGGALHSWWIEIVANTKDAERCNSGILDVKSLDSLEGYEGLPLATPPHIAASKDSPSRRSTTPPPLPKSASLPLHVSRVPSNAPAKVDKLPVQRTTPSSSSTPTPAPQLPQPAALTAPIAASPSFLFDQNPVIVDLLRQISLTRSTVLDLRTQIKDSQALAAESHLAIQQDLDAQREQKRAEDAARLELKSKNKVLDESKRSTESVKREADKKLKAAENARDKATERMERLGKEIKDLKGRMCEDTETISVAKEEGDMMEVELAKELELKKKEVKVAEDVVAALNARAKELEEKIAEEEERLMKAKEQAELRKKERIFYPLQVVQTDESPVSAMGSWSPLVPSQVPIPVQDPHTFIHTGRSATIEVFPPSFEVLGSRSRGGSASSGSGNPLPSDFSVSPRVKKVSLGAIPSFNTTQPTTVVQHSSAFPGFEDDLPARTTRFSPFADSDADVSLGLARDICAPSPKSSSLIPTSLIASLEGVGGAEDLSRSFQSDSDDVLDRDWRKMHPFPPQPVESPAAYSSSPTSLTTPSFDGVDREDPFEIRPPPLRQRLLSDVTENQRAIFLNPARSSSDPQSQMLAPLVRARTHETDDVRDKSALSGPLRWFSTSTKKGLNPEAKVFQFKKPFAMPTFSTSTKQRTSPLDNLGLRTLPISAPFNVTLPGNGNMNMHHLPLNMLPPPPTHAHLTRSEMDPDSVFSTLSMRAFAPSPAEREELARKLGSSANASLERIPTLSEVSIGSIPSSPSHVHATATTTATQRSPNGSVADVSGNRTTIMGLPNTLSWLQSLQSFPRMRKPKFSPWEDEASGGESGELEGSVGF